MPVVAVVVVMAMVAVMEVTSSGDDGLVLVFDGFDRGPEVHVFLVAMRQGGAPANLPLATIEGHKRGAIIYRYVYTPGM